MSTIGINVISETKNREGKAIKRQIVEVWQDTKDKKGSCTYHEKLSSAGNWTRKKKGK